MNGQTPILGQQDRLGAGDPLLDLGDLLDLLGARHPLSVLALSKPKRKRPRRQRRRASSASFRASAGTGVAGSCSAPAVCGAFRVPAASGPDASTRTARSRYRVDLRLPLGDLLK